MLKRNHISLRDSHNTVFTFAGDVVFAGRGEASAAVAVDGCHSELIPALGPQIGQKRVFKKGLAKQTHDRLQNVPYTPLSNSLFTIYFA